MTILTPTEVEALRDFTPGPWPLPSTEFEQDEYWGYFGHVGPAMLSGRGAVKDDPDARIVAAAPALHATCLHLHAEVARLTAELEKPIVGPWRRESFGNQVRWHASAGEGDRIAAIARAPGGWPGGWLARGFWGMPKSSGPESGDAGKRAADLALVAAGYRLVGGVFGEVSDGA